MKNIKDLGTQVELEISPEIKYKGNEAELITAIITYKENGVNRKKCVLFFISKIYPKSNKRGQSILSYSFMFVNTFVS